MYRKSEQGFTLIELLVVISIMGILAKIAIPRFTASVTMANTAKIQADLQNIDTAIVLYQLQNGTVPKNISVDLEPYLQDAAKILPPKGNCFLKGTADATEIHATTYALNAKGDRAVLDEHSASDFGR